MRANSNKGFWFPLISYSLYPLGCEINENQCQPRQLDSTMNLNEGEAKQEKLARGDLISDTFI